MENKNLIEILIDKISDKNDETAVYIKNLLTSINDIVIKENKNILEMSREELALYFAFQSPHALEWFAIAIGVSEEEITSDLVYEHYQNRKRIRK